MEEPRRASSWRSRGEAASAERLDSDEQGVRRVIGFDNATRDPSEMTFRAGAETVDRRLVTTRRPDY